MSERPEAAMTHAESAGPTAPGPGTASLDAGSGQVRVRPGSLTAADVGTMAGAAAGALGLVWLLYERILPFARAPGFWVCWYVAFLGLYWGIARTQWEPRHVREKLATAVFTGTGLLVLAVLV